jgi:hypothetical protein
MLIAALAAFLLAAMLHWHLLDPWLCPTENPLISIKVNDRPLVVEVVGTSTARRCGLAYRDTLREDRGMLFVFARAERWTFWMRGTRFPLTLAFIDAGRRITEIHALAPEMGSNGVTAGTPVRYALETHPTWFTRYDIAAGDRVDFTIPAGIVVE